MNLEEIKRISIKEYLAALGLQPTRRTSGGYMYLSPLRGEAEASFKVDENKNRWYDHGTREWGTIIGLVMALERCSAKEAIEKLKTGNMPMWTPPASPTQRAGLEVMDVRELKHDALIRYIEGRGIPMKLAALYCKQVHYRVGTGEYFAVGFQNDAGGWELRNAKYKNGSSPKTITTIDTRSDEVIVFEGFFDFLSFLSLKKLSAPPADVIVLNSVNNLQEAVESLRRHRSIKLFLDNDDAGRRTTAEVIRLVPDAAVEDCAPGWAPYNDLNDYLKAKRGL